MDFWALILQTRIWQEVFVSSPSLGKMYQSLAEKTPMVCLEGWCHIIVVSMTFVGTLSMLNIIVLFIYPLTAAISPVLGHHPLLVFTISFPLSGNIFLLHLVLCLWGLGKHFIIKQYLEKGMAFLGLSSFLLASERWAELTWCLQRPPLPHLNFWP